MISIQSIALIAVVYLLVLFLIAYLGDSERFNARLGINPNVVYALSLAVYCSSWTFYGAVGTASVEGLDYLAIYSGPCLVFIFGYPVLRRIIMICKQNNITSISDFIASRYDKSSRIGVLVAFIAVVGSLPYIALQLKAVSMSFLVLTEHTNSAQASASNISSDTVAFITGAILVLFAVLFGTRHLDATEHHRGMVTAISFESIVKLGAILVVGYYAFYLLLDQSSHDNFGDFVNSGDLQQAFSSSTSTWTSFLTKMLLSLGAIVLLPRQFQMTVVEANSHEQFKTAMWVMPIYLILTSLIVIPIALAGGVLLPQGEEDLYVLTLPLTAGNTTLGVIAFLGGLSAATGMVIVAVVSLSTMICNDLVMPNLIRIKRLDILNRENLDSIILLIRRIAILGLVAGAYGYYTLMDSNAKLANIGLVSFAAVIQFLPAVVCALFWRRAHSKGVYWGLIAGFGVWCYTLFLPTVMSDQAIFQLWGKSSWLHPQALFGWQLGNSLTHGVYWSLLANVVILVSISFRAEQSMLENIQASRFFHTGVSGVSITQLDGSRSIPVHPDALRILTERIIGIRNTQAVFDQYQQSSGVALDETTQVDKQLLSLAQTAIAGVIGSASAQKVISDIIIGEDDYLDDVSTLVDETSSVLQFNRNLLQTTLQNITHGISVVDENLNLVIWNQRYIELFDYPENFIYVGKPIREVLDCNAKRGDFGDKDAASEIRKRLKYLNQKTAYHNIRRRASGTVVKSIGEPMPKGGFVTTYEDITESVKASELLSQANEELEDRVLERTQKLKALTEELENTTRSKTHFLAAASHDLLQPINAARLFTHSVMEKSEGRQEIIDLTKNIDQSLVTANQLLRALLDISKLDSGGIQAKETTFSLKEFIDRIALEFNPIALDKNIELSVQVPDIGVKSDRQLLMSVLQNFLTNAIRYTDAGGQVSIVVDGSSEVGQYAKICVSDTGVGIEQEYLNKIFNEFYQIGASDKGKSSGLGLGLSIVERISHLLSLEVDVVSRIGEGSAFSIKVPVVAIRSGETTANSDIRFVAPSNRLQGITVLCLDNDANVLDAMRNLLEGWGCSIDCVSSYQDGIRCLDQKNYQVVLADYRLDFEQTGLDFLAEVKKRQSDDSKRSTEAILITAEQDENLEQETTNMDFHYLSKPIEPAGLKALMLFLAPRS